MGGNASAPPTTGGNEGQAPEPRGLGDRMSDGAGMALGRVALDAKSAYDTARANGGSFRQQFASGLRDTMRAARQQGRAAFVHGPQQGIEAIHAQRLAGGASPAANPPSAGPAAPTAAAPGDSGAGAAAPGAAAPRRLKRPPR